MCIVIKYITNFNFVKEKFVCLNLSSLYWKDFRSILETSDVYFVEKQNVGSGPTGSLSYIF